MPEFLEAALRLAVAVVILLAFYAADKITERFVRPPAE